MARTRHALSLLLAIALTGLSAPAAEAKRGPCIPGQKQPTCQVWTAKVFTTADGDTFNAKIFERGRWSARKDIRLLGVQAMELTDYSRAHGRKGDCHAVEAAERLEYLLQGPKVQSKIVRLVAFRKSSKTAGARGRLRRGVAYKQGGRWHDAATTLISEGHGLWDPNGKEWAWNHRLSRAAAIAARKGIRIWDPDACSSGPAQDVPFRMKVKWDADGKDGQNVNGEWVRVHNLSRTTSISLRGWSMRDAYLRQYDFPRTFNFPSGAVLAPGQSLRVHVGNGNDTPSDLFWGEPDPIFENVEGGQRAVGDGAYLFDPDGDLRAYAQYPCVLDCSDSAQGAVSFTARPEAPESMTVTNTSSSTVDLYEYEIESVPYFYEFGPGTILQPRESVTVLVALPPALDSQFVKGWGRPDYILGDKADVVSLRNPIGAPLACASWGSGIRASCPAF
jgi:endonuclease YncB( thermonuclease family)